MARSIQNKNRITETREQLEKLLVLLKKAENDEVTLAQIGRECGLRPQSLNTELQTSFSMYFKSRIRYIEPDELAGLIDELDTPSDKLLKRIFNIEAGQKVVFPEYDENRLWSVIKKSLTDRYFEVVSKHAGYKSDPMSYEAIGKELGLTRVRVKAIDDAAIEKLRSSSIITEVFFADYVDKIKEFTQYKVDKMTECDTAYTEFSKLQNYLSMIPDVKAINKYIESNYPNLSVNLVNEAVIEVFNKPIDDLNLSVRTNNALKTAGYKTLNDLYNADAIDLVNIKNLGKSSIQEIVDVLDHQKATHPKWKALKESITKMI